MIGREQRYHPEYSLLERAYIGLLGMPIVGLRIRARNVLGLLPDDLDPQKVLDAGSGPGVITFLLARRFPRAQVVGIDMLPDEVAGSRAVAARAGFTNVEFQSGDLLSLPWKAAFDLIVCVDILEHIEEDAQALEAMAGALRPGGTLLLHVPARHRRYPVFRKADNFDVPTHVRSGYEPHDIAAMALHAGLRVSSHGFTYGFVETLANNISYMITGAQKKNKGAYAVAFPLLSALSWLGRGARPSKLGAGVYLLARREPAP